MGLMSYKEGGGGRFQATYRSASWDPKRLFHVWLTWAHDKLEGIDQSEALDGIDTIDHVK